MPGQKEAGTQNPDFARHVDIAPTFLKFAGIAASDKMPGKALYEDGIFTNALTPSVYAENDFEGNILKSVHGKDGKKLITANEDNKRGLATTELYNLVDDYLEQNNLAQDPAQDPAKNTLEKDIADYQNVIKNNAAEKQSVEGVSSEVKEQLGGLGYLDE
jgi:arylsulfatase A-like enzyme